MKKALLLIVLLLSAMLWSCQEKKPSRAEAYRQSIRLKDSLAMDSARQKLVEAEDNVMQLLKELEAFKQRFVFEKIVKYQTVGYWVLPAYKGGKERFTFFPEVEETGKLLLVSIDKKRRYTFTEVDLDSEDYESLLPKGLSERQRQDVGECYAFAKTMKLLEDAQDEHVRMELKVRFYEEKKRRQEEQERIRREKKMAEKGS